MKTAGACFKQSLLSAAAILGLTFAAAVPAQTSDSLKYCEIQLTECPDTYDKKELVVPLNVVTLSTKIRTCGVQGSVESTGSGAPAIMFLIDHTRSMTTDSKTGLAGADVNGNRFRVTRALVDTIASKYPGAQIGVAVFGEGLVLDYTWDKNLVKFNGPANSFGGQSQGYLPIRALKDTADSGAYAYSYGDKPTWLNVIQGMFSVPKDQTKKSTLRKPLRPGDASSDTIVAESGGTNISIAFEAAVEAFAKIDTIYTPKRNRYIIFLSDGGPELFNGKQQKCDGQNNTSNPRCIMQDDFMRGKVWNEEKKDTLTVPTTYTVFLTAEYPPKAPEELVTMKNNIMKNGYSESNKSSNLWPLSSDYSNLLRTMMNNIVIPILNNSTGTPKTIVISTPNVKDSASVTGGSFAFNRQLLPMDITDVTEVSMGIRYDVQIDSTWKDGNGNEHKVPLTPRDSLFNYTLTIRRSADAGEDWMEKQGLSDSCKNKPKLNLLYKGDTLGNYKPVKDYMDVLQIVFDNTGGMFAYDSVIIEVRNANGDFLDSASFKLTKRGNVWDYQFKREVSASAVPGDNILQHAGQDSIILIFRNPNIPLDTIRVAVPYLSNNMAFYNKDGDPKADSTIRLLSNPTLVNAGDKLDLYVKLFDSEDNWDQDMMNQGNIDWAVSPDTTVLTKDGAHGVFSTKTVGDYTITATYTNGPLKISEQITIRVKPGPPTHIVAVTDSADIALLKSADPAKLNLLNFAHLSGDKEFIFKKNLDSTIFYAVLCDTYWNVTGMADSAEWGTKPAATKSITADPLGDESSTLASSALISRHGNSFDDNLYVTVTVYILGTSDAGKQTSTNLEDKVRISVIGEEHVAVGPNPFVPGNSPIMERLERLANGRSNTQLDLYRLIVKHSRSGGGNGNEYNANGVLVAATAQRPVWTSGGNGEVMYVTNAKAIIYDAVGHVVFRSRPGDIVSPAKEDLKDGNTFGFVWDGKNLKGKTVGWGTYAVQITATMTNGQKFARTKWIGVKFDDGYKRLR